MQKAIFEVDISAESQSSLEAHAPLSAIDEGRCFHLSNGFRHPLGTYNVSVSRVSDKVMRLCGTLEEYLRAADTLDPLKNHDEVMQKTIDYIELALYAAAEHVDDIYSIASGLFETKGKAKKHSSYKKLDKSVKEHKKFISTAANHIKHQQSRIRMFSMEFRQGNAAECLHGYFFEGVENGVVCPNRTIHKEQDVFSITTFAWEVIYLLLNLSRDLADFITSVIPQPSETLSTQCPTFSKAVIAAARLPIYTFGEEHPFARATLRINSSDNNDDELDSGLYGSIKNGWSKTLGASFGNHISRFEGDGTTKSFRFAQPKTVSLQHWD